MNTYLNFSPGTAKCDAGPVVGARTRPASWSPTRGFVTRCCRRAPIALAAYGQSRGPTAPRRARKERIWGCPSKSLKQVATHPSAYYSVGTGAGYAAALSGRPAAPGAPPTPSLPVTRSGSRRRCAAAGRRLWIFHPDRGSTHTANSFTLLCGTRLVSRFLQHPTAAQQRGVAPSRRVWKITTHQPAAA
jgi:hypothetical protein